MHSKKDSKKLKAIFLVIDIILLAAAVALGGICFLIQKSIDEIPEIDYEQKIQEFDRQQNEMESRIQAVSAMIEAGDLSADADICMAQEKLEEGQQVIREAELQRDALQAELDEVRKFDVIREKIAQIRTEYGQTVRKLEDMILAGESDYRIIYMTFDDGPTYHTNDFIKELEELDVYATFFTIGKGVENNTKLRDESLRLEALGGHSIANHTYSHAFNGALYKSVDNFINSVKQQEDVVFHATGIRTDVVRFPAGSYYAKYRKSSIEALDELGYGWIDWSGNSYDSGDNNYTSAQTANTVIWQAKQEKISVMLMHDWNRRTLGALVRIVTSLRKENYLFLPLFKESSTIGNVFPKWD